MEVYNDRLIAVLDVLGFSKKIETPCQLEFITKQYASIIQTAKQYAFNTQAIKGSPDQPTTNFEFGEFVFDSLILLSKPITPHSVSDFIFATTQIMENFFIKEFPLRGAISFGDMCLHKEPHLFISNKFKNLTECGNQQDWTGCIILQEAEEIILDNMFGMVPNVLMRSSALHYFTPPWKKPNNTKNRKFWCINWPYMLSQSELHKGLDFLKVEKNKYQNTLNYLEYTRLLPDDFQILEPKFHPAKTVHTIKSRSACTFIFRNDAGEKVEPGCGFSMEISAEL